MLLSLSVWSFSPWSWSTDVTLKLEGKMPWSSCVLNSIFCNLGRGSSDYMLVKEDDEVATLIKRTMIMHSKTSFESLKGRFLSVN